MADFLERFPRNVPGKYYIDGDCTDCDLCRELAPRNIMRDDDCGYSYIFRQPETAEEIAACEESVEGCPTEGVGNDGDLYDFYNHPIYDWAYYSSTLKGLMSNFPNHFPKAELRAFRSGQTPGQRSPQILSPPEMDNSCE